MTQPTRTTMRPGRAARGIVVLVGLVGTIVFGLLAALGVLVSWSFIVPLAMAGSGFVWLRSGIQSELRAQRAARGRARRAAARATESAPSAPVMAPRPERAADVVTTVAPPAPVVDAAPFDLADDVTATAVPAAPSVAVAAQEPQEFAPVAAQVTPLPELDEDDIPLTWDPRPVPRPTYTMKARAAERPAPRVDAQPAAEAEQPAYDEVLQRRTAGF